MASNSGNQIFVVVKKGQEYPPRVVEVRVKYEQNIGDLRRLVCKLANIDLPQLQLFWHGKELLADKYDDKTLLEMDLHTGFSLMAYDLSETPDYWPPVEQTATGLHVVQAKQ